MDGHGISLKAVLGPSGIDADYAHLIKIYAITPDASGPERKYSPDDCCIPARTGCLARPSKHWFPRLAWIPREIGGSKAGFWRRCWPGLMISVADGLQ